MEKDAILLGYEGGCDAFLIVIGMVCCSGLPH